MASDSQKKLLLKHGYIGVGQYTIDNLNKQQAADLITEYFEQERLERQGEVADLYQQENDKDPFNT